MLFKSPESYFDVLRNVDWLHDKHNKRILPKNATKEQKKAYAKYRKMINDARKNSVIIENENDSTISNVGG